MADELPGPAAVRRGSGAVRLVPRLRVGQWLGLTIGVLLILAVGGIGLALAAKSRLRGRRTDLPTTTRGVGRGLGWARWPFCPRGGAGPGRGRAPTPAPGPGPTPLPTGRG